MSYAWPTNKRPMRDHAGQTYGALQVIEAIPRASSRDCQDSTIHWACCGRDATCAQSTLNAHRAKPPRQCGRCASADGRCSDEDRRIHERAAAERGMVRDLLDQHWPVLAGWSGATKELDRRWANE